MVCSSVDITPETVGTGSRVVLVGDDDDEPVEDADAGGFESGTTMMGVVGFDCNVGPLAPFAFDAPP
jgi:hypothetical protein